MARSWIVRVFGTLPWLEGLDPRQGRRFSHPLYGLPVSDDIDVVFRVDVVDEFHVAFAVVLCREPCGVVIESEGCPVRLVVSFEVFQ